MSLYQVMRFERRVWVKIHPPESWSMAQDRAWRLAAANPGQKFRIDRMPDDHRDAADRPEQPVEEDTL